METHDISAPAPLAGFSDAVRGWFLDAFAAPTPTQERAWEAIARGENALVIAPTGSGKTLAAFLFALDALMREKARGAAAAEAEAGSAGGAQGVRVLYISPLKALGADVERNLQEPLAGIAARLDAEGGAPPNVRTGMRTGDTTPDERRALVRKPPDILITTPESLYLMLTSKARETLRRVEWVIVDEVHALAGSKRGAHLALSLERLDNLLARPAQRIGLSATVRPRDEIARFLGGPHPVSVIAAEERPALDVRVSVPVRDLTDIPAQRGARRPKREAAWKSDRALRAVMAKPDLPSGVQATPDTRAGSSSIWPHIEGAILDQVLAHRTTIVFVNSRGLCEKLTARLNELYAVRTGALPGGLGAAGGTSAAEGAVPSGIRSSMGSTSDLALGSAEVIAKAHHGSVSKEKRLQVERELKSGQLPCVVATSSLELGIDMGAIDLVLQVAPPPSVASGLQRIGRANHQVGGRSEGIIYPRTRTEVVDAAVVAEGMGRGAIERTALVRNALDVLAQQTVAAASMGELEVDAWYETVRRAAPFSDLSRRAFESVLEMLSGSYAAADLAAFSPRIVWDRERGTIAARPGGQRLAVTAAGTIPDRGLLSVVLPEGAAEAGRRRVGELDEEMVYESRVGDIIALGTSTWRIREITRDRVIVEPAPGRSARLPFWHGESVGRPAETGHARGEFLRAVAAGIEDGEGEADGCGADADAAAPGALDGVDAALQVRLRAAGLDADAARNLVALVRAQRAATGVVPDDRTLLVERCEDEAGDWRVLLHSPYGRRVHEPWALAVSERIARTLGFDAQAHAVDDGIVLRIPMTEERLPGAELFAFGADELEQVVRDRIDQTALFAARFRECAARALLVSPAAPGKRAPLWQQRLKAGQLLEAARRVPGFPLLAEAARECLQDVYDLAALRALMEGLAAGTVRLVEAQTSVPSPFAAPLLFGYVGEHLYDGDLPHAERRASLLSVDPTLLGELLGSADWTELLDEDAVHEVEEGLQRLAPDRRARGAEGAADLLRGLGPLSVAEVAQRLQAPGDAEAAAAADEARAVLAELETSRRAFRASIGGEERWAAAADGPLLQEVLGTTVPAWAQEAAAPGAGGHPLDSLLARFARTHGPFSAEAAAARFGLGPALVREGLERLAAQGRLVPGASGEAWVDADVLRRLRALSLSCARKAVRAVPAEAYERFVLDLQGIGADGRGMLEGVEGVAQVIAQFEGVFLPAAAWESQVLPARVRDYRPAMLDELVATGEVAWVGAAREEGGTRDAGAVGSAGGTVEAVAFYPTDSPLAPVPAEPAASADTPAFAAGCSAEDAVAQVLAESGGGLLFRQIVEAVQRRASSAEEDGPLRREEFREASLAAALGRLAARGRATSDTFAPIRAAAAPAAAARPRPPARRRASSRRSRSRLAEGYAAARPSAAARLSAFEGAAALAGRWSAIEPSPEGGTVRALAAVKSILDRYGVLTRDAAVLSGVPGGLAALFPVLRSMEDAGEVLRGTFVEGLGPAQFAARETVEALRAYAADDRREPSRMAVIAADDPACLFGAGIPWPPVVQIAAEGRCPEGAEEVRPTRRPGSAVVLHGGMPVLHATAGLHAVIGFTDDGALLAEAARALAAHAKRALKREGAAGARKKVLVETFNGVPVLDTPFAAILQEAGFVSLPDGLRLYVDPFA